MQEAFCFSMAWRIWIMKHKIAALVADAFQDSEYFLPKITMQDQLGLDVEVVSSKKEPIEIYSYFSRIGMLDVNKSIDEADPNDYIGVLVPGGAKSPTLLAEDPAILAFLRHVNDDRKLVASICRGSLLIAKSGIARGRHLTGFHLDSEFPDLVIRQIVVENGGIWSDDKPVVIDANLVSSRHPNDIEYFTDGIRQWLSGRTQTAVLSKSGQA
jgi:deglycase